MDPQAALREIIRTAKPDAMFLLLVPNAGFLTRRLGLYAGTQQAVVREEVRSLREWQELFGSAGFVHGLSFLTSAKARLSILVAVVSVALSLGLSLRVASSQSVYYSDETGTLRDAEAITLFLQSYLKSGDRVLLGVPSDAPLIYYFDRYGVPRTRLTTNLASSRRVVVLVNLSSRQTVEAILDSVKLDRGRFDGAQRLRTYKSAIIYPLDRRP